MTKGQAMKLAFQMMDRADRQDFEWAHFKSDFFVLGPHAGYNTLRVGSSTLYEMLTPSSKGTFLFVHEAEGRCYAWDSSIYDGSYARAGWKLEVV